MRSIETDGGELRDQSSTARNPLLRWEI